jgi:hypothetical protein
MVSIIVDCVLLLPNWVSFFWVYAYFFRCPSLGFLCFFCFFFVGVPSIYFMLKITDLSIFYFSDFILIVLSIFFPLSILLSMLVHRVSLI